LRVTPSKPALIKYYVADNDDKPQHQLSLFFIKYEVYKKFKCTSMLAFFNFMVIKLHLLRELHHLSLEHH